MSEEQLEGRNPVLEALRSGRPLHRILVARGERHGSVLDILRFAHESGVPVEEVDRRELDRRSGCRAHQGVLALAAARAYATLEDILQNAGGRGEAPFLVVAAGLQDPQNLGSLLRSAEAAGAHGVILPERRSVGLTPAAVKASAGASEHLPVARVVNLARALEGLKERGLWVYGADPGGDRPYFEADLRGPLALVIGSEGRGMPRLVRERCDGLIRIPMKGRVGSLNAAVAAAIILFEASRQRNC